MLIEQYYKWKKGLLTTGILHEKIEFFNTNPTDLQIEILDRYLSKRELVFLSISLVFFASGIALGIAFFLTENLKL